MRAIIYLDEAEGMALTAAADMLGVSYSTILRYALRDYFIKLRPHDGRGRSS